MKKSTIAIAAVALLAACKKDSSTTTTPTPTPTPTTKTFTFKADGTSITLDSARATLYTLGVSPYNREIDVFGFKGGKTVIEFHFLPKTGKQNASASFSDAWLTYADDTKTYDAQSGELNLTVCDTVNNKIEGTFNFSGKEFSGTATKSITEGTIYVDNMKKQ